MSTDYYKQYIKYKSKYLKLKYGGATLPDIKEYQIGVLQMYKKDQDLSSLKVLEIGMSDILDSIVMSKKFKSYLGVDPDCEIINKAQEVCKKHSCKIEFMKFTIEDIPKEDTYDFILLKDFYNKVPNYGKALDSMLDLLDDDGIILIDQTKDKDNNLDLDEYLMKKASRKYNIKVNHLDKKQRDLYSITKRFAEFNQTKKDIPVPPAERWY